MSARLGVAATCVPRSSVLAGARPACRVRLSDVLHQLVSALKALWLGIAAVSLTFLAGYGGMVSLAQTALFGVAGLTRRSWRVATASTGWAGGAASASSRPPSVGLLFGASPAAPGHLLPGHHAGVRRVVTYFYFAAGADVRRARGHQRRPRRRRSSATRSPTRRGMYYSVLIVVGRCCTWGCATSSRTAFGLALQGVRDDPVRMARAGLQRAAAPHARRSRSPRPSPASPASVGLVEHPDLGRTRSRCRVAIVVLTAAVIGGLNRLEGAWVGAFIYTLCDTYLRGCTDRFSTWLGVVFLVIVLVSPGGVVGVARQPRPGRPAPRRPGRARPPGALPSRCSRTRHRRAAV